MAITITISGATAGQSNRARTAIGSALGLPAPGGVQQLASIAQIEGWLRTQLIERVQMYEQHRDSQTAIAAVQPLD